MNIIGHRRVFYKIIMELSPARVLARCNCGRIFGHYHKRGHMTYIACGQCGPGCKGNVTHLHTQLTALDWLAIRAYATYRPELPAPLLPPQPHWDSDPRATGPLPVVHIDRYPPGDYLTATEHALLACTGPPENFRAYLRQQPVSFL